MRSAPSFAALVVLFALSACGTSDTPPPPAPTSENWSVARTWNEVLLEGIRNDFARPTVHARNVFHVSAAMWDAWAAYDPVALPVLVSEIGTSPDTEAAREEAISYACYRILRSRFQNSPGSAQTLGLIDSTMAGLGFNPAVTTQVGGTPAAIGNRIAASILAFGQVDGSNEAGGFTNQFYLPVNDPLVVILPGNPTISDPNRWQPLALQFNVDQAGNPLPTGALPFLSPEWGQVVPFALSASDLTVFPRGGFDYWVYHDPGPPPQHGGAGDLLYKQGFEQVLEWSSFLDPTDGVTLNISPAARGNNVLGSNSGTGYATNSATGQPYADQVVPAGDYYRVLAEFWADGPDSETPPGHWFVIANYVSDQPQLIRRFEGVGAELDPLEWDVKLYLALSGAMHDVAITAWGIKGWYDYTRPISALRFLGDLGQRTDPGGPSYHPGGIELVPGRVEVITAASSAPGERHEHLAGPADDNLGKIAVRAWRGPDFVANPQTDTAGVGWILLEEWWPYQRPSFVTPPFAGYISGHSTYSRAAATVLSRFTGSEFFPGGLGQFPCPQNSFLVFEEGPSVTITLQWAKYFDAADECSLSRIYGGIHPPADDIPGRFIGAQIGADAYDFARTRFGP
ncbi:MAG: vanadium-dependent haloperoxidase [Planctomycetota bacterium]|nr:vanadium-dependent haloperoxidase [Planctomycetota bacterium]